MLCGKAFLHNRAMSDMCLTAMLAGDGMNFVFHIEQHMVETHPATAAHVKTIVHGKKSGYAILSYVSGESFSRGSA